MAPRFYGNPDFYQRKARAYDAMVSSKLYNLAVWGTHPDDYAAFAARAIGSASGPLLEVAAGTAAATRLLHVASRRRTTLVDLASPMLEIARRNIAEAAGGSVPERIDFACRDMLDPPEGDGYETVLGLGLLHLVDDVPLVVDGLLAQLVPDGQLHLASLVLGSRRSSAYLRLLHSAGETVEPRTVEQLEEAVRRSSASAVEVERRGAMAYVVARP